MLPRLIELNPYWFELMAILLPIVGLAALTRLSPLTRILLILFFLPMGSCNVTVQDHRGTGQGTMVLLTLLALPPGVLLLPFSRTRRLGLAVVAATGLLWLGYLGLLLILAAVLRLI